MKKIINNTKKNYPLSSKLSWWRLPEEVKNVEDRTTALENGISGASYIVISAKGTPEENAKSFIEAYGKAVAATKDAEKRFTLVLSPGHYKFSQTFNHNENYIDIVSLTGEQDVIFDLELKGQDPLVLDSTPPVVPFKYIYDLDIDINDGVTIYSDSLKSGQPYFLNTTDQLSPQITFDTNGLGYKGNPYSTFPVYGGFSAGASDKVVASYKFIHNEYTGEDNYQSRVISLYDNTLAILPEYESGDVNQLFCYITNQGTLSIQNPLGGSSLAISLINGEEYTIELVNDPGEAVQEVRIKDSEGIVIDNTSTTYYEISASTYSVAISMENIGPSYYPSIIRTSEVMSISADYSMISGIKTKEYDSTNYVAWSSSFYSGESSHYPLPLNVVTDFYENLEVKNCTAGPFSFASNWGPSNFSSSNDIQAIFTDCTALAYSFGYGAYKIESGSIFTNCKAGNNSFYIEDDLRGTFTNCTAGNESFYSNNDDIEGTFTNCTAGDYSFCTDDEDIRGTFINCKGGYRSFYADDSFYDATFTNCIAGDYSFEADIYIDETVTFTNCTAGNNSFVADDDDNDGTYINCTAGIDSFYAYYNNDGTYRNCVAQQGSFYSDDDSYNMHCYYCLLYGSDFNGGNQEYCLSSL